VKLEKQQQQPVKGVGMSPPEHGIPPHLVNGTILKTALTNPGEVSINLREEFLKSFNRGNSSSGGFVVPKSKRELKGRKSAFPSTH
jgi:hypothetical protein